MGLGGFECVRLFAVNDGVDAGDLVFVLDPEAHRLLDDPADDEGENERVDSDAEGTDELSEQLVERARVDEADADAEEADVERSDDSTDQVDGDHIERVIEPELELELDRQRADGTDDESEQDAPARSQDVTGRGDGDEARNGAGRRTDRGRLAVLDLLDDQPADGGGGGGGERVDPGQ